MTSTLNHSKKWTVLVVTCQPNGSVDAIEKELEARQEKGLISNDVLILTVEDPKQGVGSGGATLNALYVAAEHLGAQLGHTVVTTEVLKESNILIVHTGRQYPFDSCGRTFINLPLCHRNNENPDVMFTNFDLLLDTVSNYLAADSLPGVWVCSSDMLLNAPQKLVIESRSLGDFSLISTLESVKYARSHGALKLGDDGRVLDIIYKGKADVVQECADNSGSVPIVCGIIYISSRLADKLLSMTVTPPLDACTYIGLDNGAQPLSMSLYFDIALAMCEDIDEEKYVTGDRSGVFGTGKHADGDEGVAMKFARSQLWRELHANFHATSVIIEGGQHNYLDTNGATLHNYLLTGSMMKNSNSSWMDRSIIHSQVPEKFELPKPMTILNSIIEDKVQLASKSVISNCHLPSNISISQDCSLTGLLPIDFEGYPKMSLPENVLINAFSIRVPICGKSTAMRILTVVGKYDNLTVPMWKGSSTYCNSPWILFLNATSITKEDLWTPDTAEDDLNIMNAKMFPVASTTDSPSLADILWLTDTENTNRAFVNKWRSSWRLSISEILSLVDHEQEFASRREIFYAVGQNQMRDILLSGKKEGLSGFYKNAIVDGYESQLLATLDRIAIDCNSPGICARTLGNIADILSHMARDKGGMKSGPSKNKQWKEAFQKFEEGNMPEGVKIMAKERSKWLSRPTHLVRAARHYEGAAQILIRHAVMTAKEFISTEAGKPLCGGQWVVAECPARLDLSGGWSDTPPITYEHGGAVTTLAIKYDGKRPIGAKVRIIPENQLVIHVGSGSSKRILTCKTYKDLADYNQPHAPGALLKAAFYCADVIQLDDKVTLQEQLKDKYNGGFEIIVWSNLPQGSGLGTSSILAGAVMAALWTVTGQSFRLKDLIHAVLNLEQMLTTGGGWQDQVGGLVGGLVISSSADKLPLEVEFRKLVATDSFIKAINHQLVLIYTGKTRLARDLLQCVIRQWYARIPGVVQTVDDLVVTANDCADAFENEDMIEVGVCLNKYMQAKKILAPGCELSTVAALRKALQPYTMGMCIAGAGAGGFLYIFLKPEYSASILPDILSKIEGGDSLSIHQAEVDVDGLSLRVESGEGSGDNV